MDDLTKDTTISTSLGHLLLIWDILSSKLSGLPLNENFTEEEKRAIWGLEDLCERELIRNGITGKPQREWEQLVEAARKHVKSIPVD